MTVIVKPNQPVIVVHPPTQAKVVVGGKSTNVVVPQGRGEKGDPGSVGPTGPEGDTGPPGSVGPQGPQGSPGPQGIQGPTGPQGVQGTIGPQGVQGDVGPQGAAGTAVGAATYVWSSNLVASDPGSGRIKANHSIDTGITEVYASVHSDNGRLVRLDQLEVGGTLFIYESAQFTTWSSYTVTGPVVVNANEWYLIPVAFEESGPEAFTPGDNMAVEITTPVMGEQGEQGIQGPQGAQGIQGVAGPTGPQGVQGKSVSVTENEVAPADPTVGDIWNQKIPVPIVPPDVANLMMGFDALATHDLASWTNPYGDGWSFATQGASPMPVLQADGLHFSGSQRTRLYGPLHAAIPTQATVYFTYRVGSSVMYTLVSAGTAEWTAHSGGASYPGLLQAVRHETYRADMPVNPDAAIHTIAYLADASTFQLNRDAIPGTVATSKGYTPTALNDIEFGDYWLLGYNSQGHGQFDGVIRAIFVYDALHDTATQTAVRAHLTTNLGVAGTYEYVPRVWDGVEWALMEGTQGPQGVSGPPGAQGVWVEMTAAAYAALPVKDPAVLYVVKG